MANNELGEDARRHFIETPDISLRIKGVQLKTRVMPPLPPGFHGNSFDGKWRDGRGETKRRKNPEAGDWQLNFAPIICVFDGEKWVKDIVRLRDTNEDDIEKMKLLNDAKEMFLDLLWRHPCGLGITEDANILNGK